MSAFDIPSLDPRTLATTIPTAVYAGGTVSAPTTTLFLWRSMTTAKAQGGTLCFYLDDARLESLWKRPAHYGAQFLRSGIRAVVEVDFSVWTNDALAVQIHNIYRMRALSRFWQDRGVLVMPNLSWSDDRSFAFAFAGIPVGAPVCMTECRTAGSNDPDRRAFLRGLTEAVRQIQPHHITIYGGRRHQYWLHDRLPCGPTYHLIDSWTDARGTIRTAQERHARERQQLNLFQGGEVWVEEAVVAAA